MVAAALVFAHPLVLLALPVLAAAGYYFWRYTRKRSARRIGLFVAAGARQDAVAALHTWPRRLRFVLPAAALALLVLAASRPLTGPKSGQAERRGVDFVVALDVSKSMWAEDVKPNRLDAAKQELLTWMKTQPGDRTGLVAFAGDAVIQAPVTADLQALARVLAGASPKNFSKGGTNISEAISMAVTLLKKSNLDTKALVIFSDGENLDGDPVAAARKAHDKEGLAIFTVGVGTDAGEKVPSMDYVDFAKNPNRNRVYARNEYGSEVVSRRDEAALQRIAAAGGGRYFAFAPGTNFFAKFRDEALQPLSRSRQVLDPRDYHEWFQIPLFLAILLLMVEPLLPRTRRKAADAPGVAVVNPGENAPNAGAPVRFGRSAARPVVKLVLLGLLVTLQAGQAADMRDLQAAAEKMLAEKKPAEAIALLEAAVRQNPTDALLRYNYGLILAQAGKFEDAISAFQEAKLASDDPQLRARALFQLGNAQYHLGRKLNNQGAAVLSLERSLAFYDELIAEHPGSDVTHNRKVAEETLETILEKIAEDRLKVAENLTQKDQPAPAARNLREALDALEKLAALAPEEKPRAEKVTQTRQKLADALLKTAEKHIAETDRLETLNDKDRDRQVLARRQQGVELLEEAQAQTPSDQHIQQAIQQQQQKMADLLTRRAAEKIAPVLPKEKVDTADLDALFKGSRELSDALELAPGNPPSQDLKDKADAKLQGELTRLGEQSLANAEKPGDPRNRLQSANAAADFFQKADTVKPDQERVKQGLEKTLALLPQLHAEAAAKDLADAKALLKPSGDEKEPSQANLKKAVGALETATQNFNRAQSLKPDDENIQKGLAEAQQLLSASRDDLSKQRQQADAASSSQEQPPAGPSKPSSPDTKVYSQMPVKNSTDPSTGESFWQRTKKDW